MNIIDLLAQRVHPGKLPLARRSLQGLCCK
jgi:hypothetical protein